MTFDEWCTQVETILIHALDRNSWEVYFFMTMNVEVLAMLYNRELTPSQAVFDVMH